MKDIEKIKEIYNKIAYFNDGRFMNQDYRNGLLDALSFVLYENSFLERIGEKLK